MSPAVTKLVTALIAISILGAVTFSLAISATNSVA